jgi:hypothetical protein
MSRRILLLTFDAFGTLFTPRRPISAQYVEVAARHGLVVDEHVLRSTFRDGTLDYIGLYVNVHKQLSNATLLAFRHQSTSHPNYGKASGMKPSEWWTDVRYIVCAITSPPLVACPRETELQPNIKPPHLAHMYGFLFAV